jgi:hypothetical protein
MIAEGSLERRQPAEQGLFCWRIQLGRRWSNIILIFGISQDSGCSNILLPAHRQAAEATGLYYLSRKTEHPFI